MFVRRLFPIHQRLFRCFLAPYSLPSKKERSAPRNLTNSLPGNFLPGLPVRLRPPFPSILAMASPLSDAPLAPPLPVVIVGGGLAGLSAATEVLTLGGSVVIIEKMDRLGGNSAKASSGMNAAGSGPQKAAGIEDSPDLLLNDTMKSGQGLSSHILAMTVAEESAGAVEFLQQFGINLDSIQQLGGHSRPRTHRSAPDGKPMNIGYRIMSALIGHLQEQEKKEPEKVRILVKSMVSKLLTEGTPEGAQRVVGVRAEKESGEGGAVSEDIKGTAVILATGGYSADREGLIEKHAPCLRLLPTTNGPFATGDGVRLGEAVGAALVDMDQVQVHPTGLVDPKDPSSPVKILGPEILRGSGGILLNSKGERFVNELATRDQVVAAMLKHCSLLTPDSGAPPCSPEDTAKGECCPVPSVAAHLVLSEEAFQRFGEAMAKFYLAKGLMRKFSSLQDLCESLGLPLPTVQFTLSSYNKAALGSEADPFGKTVFPCQYTAYGHSEAGSPPKVEGESQPPIYTALVTPVLHYCMGGLAFDYLGHVLRDKGNERIIPGLLAAGEVTGGLHGANRLAGNSLLECVVFGRVAAKTVMYEYGEQQELMTPGDLMDFRKIVGGKGKDGKGDASYGRREEL